MDRELVKKFTELEEDDVLQLVQEAIDNGTEPQSILKACQTAMVAIGEKFEEKIYFVSDLMLAGHLFKEVGSIVKPLFKGNDAAASAGKVVLGTVEGDIHDIGKDLVLAMLEANNYEVYDVGVDQPKEVFIEKLQETGATVLALSGLLTVAFESMKETIAELDKAGMRNNVKVMIGGGPINQGVCDYTGADGWGDNAQTAVKLCREWIGG